MERHKENISQPQAHEKTGAGWPKVNAETLMRLDRLIEHMQTALSSENILSISSGRRCLSNLSHDLGGTGYWRTGEMERKKLRTIMGLLFQADLVLAKAKWREAGDQMGNMERDDRDLLSTALTARSPQDTVENMADSDLRRRTSELADARKALTEHRFLKHGFEGLRPKGCRP